MIYTLFMLDRPNAGEVRRLVRPEHKAYLGLMAHRIAFAGPLAADDGQTLLGSLLAIEFPDRAAVDEWLRDEPFNKAGLYGSIQVNVFLNLWPQTAGFPPQ